MTVTFKLRRGTAAEWLADNPILTHGEPGFEIDTGRLKIGNGMSTWSNLRYQVGLVDVPHELVDAPTILTNVALASTFRVILGGDRTLGDPTGMVDGDRVIWEFIQDGTGGRMITLGPAFRFGTDISAITLSSPPNKRDFMGAIYNGEEDCWYVIAYIRGY